MNNCLVVGSGFHPAARREAMPASKSKGTRMDVQVNLESIAPSWLRERASRGAIKIIFWLWKVAPGEAKAVVLAPPVLLALLALGLSVLAFLAARALNVDPAQAAATSSHGPTTASVAPATTLVEPSAAFATPNVADGSKIAGAGLGVLTGSPLSVGDRLKVAFYERVEVEEDRWGRMSSTAALRGIVQRPELGGEYTVQADGTISIPLLGFLPVVNRSVQQVQADLVERFELLLGRKALVNILSLERSPIYVLGPVKNPGSFKFVPGMTILHAIALAGGLDRAASEPWQKIETAREIQKRSGAVEAMLKLLARGAVLTAERDGTTPKIPLRLIEMVGATEAAKLVNEQGDRRKAVAATRRNRERAILSALDSAKQDVAVYGRTESLDELVKLRQERVDSTRALVDRNVLNKGFLNQVQTDLSDAQQRRQDALNQYATARQRVASLEAEALRIQGDLRNDLEAEIEGIERQVADNEREFNISEEVLSTLPGTRAQFAKEVNRVTYQVVRQTSDRPVSIPSTGMTQLQPGDLVNIVVGESVSGPQPVSPISTSPPDER
jgi:protein involved in polysaccharide export with SLBB domain